ncbi:50S ribosomal protein L10 [Candidatus Woesearchaeota archaeon]|nr:50S ribosomal protein L10 [Candidatus Woesearchaeota archaeon]
MTYQAKAAQYKKDTVALLSGQLKEYPVVGLVNVENLPARQLQVLRSKLRKDALITMSKKVLIKRAMDSVEDKKDFEKLSEYVTGMPALILTQKDPFRISTLIRASKSKAPAKPGQIAPYDLVIPAGPTQFTPGPIISELGAFGLKTGVEGGKVAIKSPATIVRKGEVISAKACDLLAKFSIEPMEIGLDLVAAYENGLVFGKEVLSIDSAEYVNMVKAAAAESLGLAIEIGYPTAENIERLISVAYNTCKNFALQQNILSDIVIERYIGQAERAANAIAKAANIPEAAAKTEEAVSKPQQAAEIAEEQLRKSRPAAPQPAAPETQAESGKAEPEVKPQKQEGQPSAAQINPEKPDGKQEAEKDALARAEQLSADFRKEIAAEKERRDKLDQNQAEVLANELKKKGTLRQ